MLNFSYPLQSKIGLDKDTWARARGWALWKALITIAPLDDKNCLMGKKNLKVIDEILSDHSDGNGL